MQYVCALSLDEVLSVLLYTLRLEKRLIQPIQVSRLHSRHLHPPGVFAQVPHRTLQRLDLALQRIHFPRRSNSAFLPCLCRWICLLDYVHLTSALAPPLPVLLHILDFFGLSLWALRELHLALLRLLDLRLQLRDALVLLRGVAHTRLEEFNFDARFLNRLVA